MRSFARWHCNPQTRRIWSIFLGMFESDVEDLTAGRPFFGRMTLVSGSGTFSSGVAPATMGPMVSRGGGMLSSSQDDAMSIQAPLIVFAF